MEEPARESTSPIRDEMGTQEDRSAFSSSTVEIDRKSTSKDEESPIGQQEIFYLSHWGCIGYLTLLLLVTVATIVQVVRIWLLPDMNASVPIIWALAIFLMIALTVALGWRPLSMVIMGRRKKKGSENDAAPETDQQAQ